MKKNEMYIYLARRDKTSVRFIGGFSYASKVYPTRISPENIASLNMSPQASSMIAEEVSKNKMEYELYMETASSFEELKLSLSRRGYSHLPSHHFSSNINSGNIDPRMLVTKNSTMMRRSSNVR
jgi:hypothetical protein